MKKLNSFLLLLVFVSNAFSQEWQWVNPSPTGNNLNQVFYTGNSTWYAVGDFGAIIKSTDQGSTWIAANSRTSASLNSVFFLDENLGYVAGISGAVFKTTDGGNTWIDVSTGMTRDLRSICFTDALTGYVAGDTGTILKTVNGGETWQIQISGTQSQLNSVFFTDTETGFVVGNSGTIRKTTNGGINWIEQSSGTSMPLKSVHFVNSLIGYATGGLPDPPNSDVLKTIDGGANWYSMPFNAMHNLFSICFINPDTGYAAGTGYSSGGGIFKTTDGANTWAMVGGSVSFLSSVCFKDAEYGVVVGDIGHIRVSSDGGNSWTWNTEYTTTIGEMCFSPGRKIYMADDYGKIIKIDPANGDAISTISDNIGSAGISFPGDDIGYVARFQDSVYKTTDAGASWQSLFIADWFYITALFFTDVNTGYLAGFNQQVHGQIYKTTDGGQSWNLQFTGASNSTSLDDLFFVNDLTGFAIGNGQTILKTIDGGDHWILHTSPSSYGMNAIYFIDEITGCACGLYGTIIKSTDGGNNWTLVNSMTASYTFYDICFINPDTGFAVGVDYYGGLLMKTVDGGETWFRDSLQVSGRLGAITFFDSKKGYIAGEYGTILTTNDGGATWVDETGKPDPGIAIWPNPFDNEITVVKSDFHGNYRISIMDLGGRTYFQGDFKVKENRIDLGELPAGIYILEAKDHFGSAAVKVLKSSR